MTAGGAVRGMPVYRLTDAPAFPSPDEAEPDGLLAVGGDLRPERLLTAYAMGIFPWYGDDLPILWHSPDPRLVLIPSRLRVPRSLKKAVRRGKLAIRMDTAFDGVIRACAGAARPSQDGTWITDDMVEAYVALHDLGFAHSVEAWNGNELVGGLYGVSLGRVFFGESMFAREADASKIALVWFVRQFDAWGFDLIDCQIHTEHLERFGAELWPRDRFLEALGRSLESPPRRGRWCFDPDFTPTELEGA